jgi:phosphoserine phosphatase RsbU/P
MNTKFEHNEPRLRDTIRQDFRHGDFWRTFRHEFRELKEFYIDEERKKQLELMKPVKRFWYLSWWLCKSMLLRLTPLRRILLVVGIFFFVVGNSIEIKGGKIDFQSNNSYLVGGALLLLVIMLELKDKLLARDELAAGKKVQQALMPEQKPSVPGWSLWIYSQPANEVGGDLIDFITRSDGRYGVVIADVSGKGLQAALITAKLQATIKAFATEYDSNVALISKLNAIFHRDGLPNSFASLVFIDLHQNNGSVRFVNAGHLPPVVVTDHGIKETEKGDPAIGLIGTAGYSERSAELQPGDLFVGYSDGLTEARNTHGEFFGSDRLFKRLPTLRSRSPEEIGRALMSEIEFFTKDVAPADDISLVVLKRV